MPTDNSNPTLQKKPAKPHLLVFCPLYPPHIGGLESHAEQWNQALADKGYQIITFTPLVIKNSLEHEKPQSNHTIFRFPAWEIIPNFPIPAFWRPSFWKLWKQIKSHLGNSYNVVIISRTRFFLTTPLAFIVSRRYNRPWLHIEHGADHVQSQNFIIYSLAYLFDLTLGRYLLNNADLIVTNSEASARFVNKLSPQARPQVLYRGVKQEKIEQIIPANLKKYKLPTEKYLITYVGRLIDGKGLPDLLSAFSQLDHTNSHLIFIGKGPQNNQLIHQTKKLDITTNVTFVGAKSWSEAISLMKVSDIVVNPSYSEGLPTSLIEAALCKKAIIATNVGGTPEIITHNKSGLLYSAGDIDVLTAHLKNLLSNTELRYRLGQEAYRQNQNRFTWDAVIPQYEHLFLQILNKNKLAEKIR